MGAHPYADGLRRKRCIVAAAELAAEHDGPDGVHVSHLRRRAGVAQKSFYECFSGKDDCFAQALGWIVACVSEAAKFAGWPGVLTYLTANPCEARLLLIDGIKISPAAYETAVDELTRSTFGAEPTVPQEAAIGGALHIVRRRVSDDGRAADLRLLQDDLRLLLDPLRGDDA